MAMIDMVDFSVAAIRSLGMFIVGFKAGKK